MGAWFSCFLAVDCCLLLIHRLGGKDTLEGGCGRFHKIWSYWIVATQQTWCCSSRFFLLADFIRHFGRASHFDDLEFWFAFCRDPLLDFIKHKQIAFYRCHIPGLACSQHIHCPMYMAILYVLVAFQLFAKTINSQELYMHHAIFIVGLAVRLWELDNLVRKMPHWPLTSDVLQGVSRISSELTISCYVVIFQRCWFQKRWHFSLFLPTEFVTKAAI